MARMANLKAWTLLTCLIWLLLGLSHPTNAFNIRWDDQDAKVGYILQREYQDTLKKLVHQAKKEIVILMYFMDYTKRGDDPIVVELVDDIINARKRGIKVTVILENTLLLNNRAYTKFLKNDIEVYWDHHSQITHAKLVVIDKKLVVIGSTPDFVTSFLND